MSVSRPNQRRLALALGLIAVATIAACDSHPTQPAGSLTRLPRQLRAIDGDTTQCAYGWIVINGVYVCNEES